MTYRYEVKRIGLAASRYCAYILRVWRGTRLYYQATYSNPDDALHRGKTMCRILAKRSK